MGDYMSKKKHIGKYLETKRSWNKVIGYLKKRLLKSVPWDFTYEFDSGHIRVQIIPISTNHKGKKIVAEIGHAGVAEGDISNADGLKMHRRRRKKEWQ